MATGTFASELVSALLVAPARRDLLAVKPSDAYSPIFYNSALFSRSWLDPSPNDTENIFRGLIEGVLSNNATARDSLADANAKLNLLLLK